MCCVAATLIVAPISAPASGKIASAESRVWRVYIVELS
jgi:hypothetical protein